MLFCSMQALLAGIVSTNKARVSAKNNNRLYESSGAIGSPAAKQIGNNKC